MNLVHSYVYRWELDPLAFSSIKVDYANGKLVEFGLKEASDFNFASLNIQGLLRRSDKKHITMQRFRKVKNVVKAINQTQASLSSDIFLDIDSTPEQDKLHALYFNSQKRIPLDTGQDAGQGFSYLNSPAAYTKRRKEQEVPEFIKSAGPLALKLNKIFDSIDKSTQDHDSSSFKASSINPYYQFSTIVDPLKAHKSESFTMDASNLKPVQGPAQGADIKKAARPLAPQKRRDSVRHASVPKSFKLNRSSGNAGYSLPKIRK